MYHGWSDPQVTPLNSVFYYNDVLKTVGKSSAREIHCAVHDAGNESLCGGPGTDTFDKVKVMEEWVEQGKAPKQNCRLPLHSGAVDKTRPLCPYPQIAKYNGSGDTNDAANFPVSSGGKNSANDARWLVLLSADVSCRIRLGGFMRRGMILLLALFCVAALAQRGRGGPLKADAALA